MKAALLLETIFVACLVQVFADTSAHRCGNKTHCEILQDLQDQMNHLKKYIAEFVDMPKDCDSIKQRDPSAVSGVYLIKPTGGSYMQAYCDMTTDVGGWLVFQRRQDGSENFYRKWEDYEKGFGNLEGEFWIGNKDLHIITSQKTYELRVDMRDFEGNITYAVYSQFSVDSPANDYKLSLGEYSGTSGDSLTYSNGQRFSTFDNDNDPYYDNCARLFQGAWWYKTCHNCNLNGLYLRGAHEQRAVGVNWYEWRGFFYSLKLAEMKIRPAK